MKSQKVHREAQQTPRDGFPVHTHWDVGITALIFVVGVLIGNAIRHSRFKKPVTLNGYVRRKPFWGRPKYEHRDVAEKILGRRLERGEVVHHINGRRSDNKPENLCVMDGEDHDRYHRWYDWVFGTYGKYPKRETQLRKLREDFSGVLLADVLKRRR